MAVLALDCSCAFDLVDHNLVASSLELIGSGPKMVAPTILEIKKYVVHKAAWASRDKFLSYESRGPMTRSRSKMNLPLPDEKGWRGKMVSTILFKAWNELSCVVKSCNIEEKVKYLLKSEIFTFA